MMLTHRSHRRFRWPLRAALIVSGAVLAALTSTAPAWADDVATIDTATVPCPVLEGYEVATQCSIYEPDPTVGATFEATYTDRYIGRAIQGAEDTALYMAARQHYTARQCRLTSETAVYSESQGWTVTATYHCTR